MQLTLTEALKVKEPKVVMTDTQRMCVDQCFENLKTDDGLLLYGDMRTGKTIVSLETAKRLGLQNVLFLTKKAIIPNIREDYDKINAIDAFNIEITTTDAFVARQRYYAINEYDLIVIDESHKKIAAYLRQQEPLG